MAERDLELKQVPVSFFVKKVSRKQLTKQTKCAAAFATEIKESVAKAALGSRYKPDFKEGTR